MSAFPRRNGPPLAEPLSLAEVLVHLKEDPGVQDVYIESLIRVAREACEDRLERSLVTTPWRLTLDAFPAAIKLYRPPVIAVQAVQFRDEEGVLQTLDPQDYELDRVSEPGYLVPAYGLSWPATRAQINAVTVDYTAGYGDTGASVPMPIKQWMLLAIGDMYANRNTASEKPRVRNEFAHVLLDPYRIWGD